jgi:hypothetical protein
VGKGSTCQDRPAALQNGQSWSLNSTSVIARPRVLRDCADGDLEARAQSVS